jgi:hypothetical protein
LILLIVGSLEYVSPPHDALTKNEKSTGIVKPLMQNCR